MPAVILAGPEHPGNVGSVARVMQNFGLRELVLIDPRCDHRSKDARNHAKGAQDILAHARVEDWDALKRFRVVAATAGKTVTEKNLLRSPLEPRDAAQRIAGAKDAAILFGRESVGLTNAELAKADFVITIPTAENPSLNLSHAVAIVLYELLLARGSPRFTPAPADRKAALFQKADELIDSLAFPHEGMRVTQKRIWHSILGRAVLTRSEASAALGFYRAIAKQRNRRSTTARR